MRDPVRRLSLLLAAAALIPACGDGGSQSAGTPADAAPQNLDDGATTGQPPFIRIVNPGPRSTCRKGATINIQAVGIDPDTTIARVDFFDGTTLIGRRWAPPFILAWGGLRPGTHVLTVVAFDAEGQTSVSAPVIVIVLDDDKDDKDDDDDDDDDDDRRGRR